MGLGFICPIESRARSVAAVPMTMEGPWMLIFMASVDVWLREDRRLNDSSTGNNIQGKVRAQRMLGRISRRTDQNPCGEREKMENVSEAYDRLVEWANNLKRSVEADRKEFEDTLAGKTKLPDNCPSRASMGHLVFRGVEQALDELNAAKRDVEKAMWHHHGKQK